MDPLRGRPSQLPWRKGGTLFFASLLVSVPVTPVGTIPRTFEGAQLPRIDTMSAAVHASATAATGGLRSLDGVGVSSGASSAVSESSITSDGSTTVIDTLVETRGAEGTKTQIEHRVVPANAGENVLVATTSGAARASATVHVGGNAAAEDSAAAPPADRAHFDGPPGPPPIENAALSAPRTPNALSAFFRWALRWLSLW